MSKVFPGPIFTRDFLVGDFTLTGSPLYFSRTLAAIA
jgi:hypothetical protein